MISLLNKTSWSEQHDLKIRSTYSPWLRSVCVDVCKQSFGWTNDDRMPRHPLYCKHMTGTCRDARCPARLQTRGLAAVSVQKVWTATLKEQGLWRLMGRTGSRQFNFDRGQKVAEEKVRQAENGFEKKLLNLHAMVRIGFRETARGKSTKELREVWKDTHVLQTYWQTPLNLKFQYKHWLLLCHSWSFTIQSLNSPSYLPPGKGEFRD